ncbi:response regulator (plasmid) [Microvirga sp. VF16]|nr:response regulator [Microvirga sp. VF16]QRM33646.1 response regulator [Microvirga sp. VF16]
MSDHSPVWVLYIDDDPGLARRVQRTLEQKGYGVELSSNGADGLRQLRRGGIDIVALDHHMLGQTGLDILPQIQALPQPPPVIYVTGCEDSRIAVAALKAGAANYVWKDIQGHFWELLVEAIVTALEKERLRRAKDQAEQEAREARDRAELLLREMNHRIASSLALVAALAHLQTASVDNPAAASALKEMQARVMAIAGVHRRLYNSDDVCVVAIDAYLASLVEDLDVTMRAAGRQHPIRLDAEPIQMGMSCLDGARLAM